MQSIRGKRVAEFTDEELSESIIRLGNEIEREESAGGPSDTTKQSRIMFALQRESLVRNFRTKSIDDPNRPRIAAHIEAHYGVRVMDDEWVQAEAQRQIEQQKAYAEIEALR